MTKNEMTKFLIKQYRSQCETHPRTQEIPEKQYIRVNLSHMIRSPYWRNRPIGGYAQQ
jgi:hypothetical protein